MLMVNQTPYLYVCTLIAIDRFLIPHYIPFHSTPLTYTSYPIVFPPYNLPKTTLLNNNTTIKQPSP